MGESGSVTGRKRRGQVVATCITLAVCLMITTGVVFVVNRISTAVGNWEPPVSASSEPSDGTVRTPSHDELDGPPGNSRVTAQEDDPEGASADEQHTPDAVPRPSDPWLDEVSEATDVPRRALFGYATAQLVLAEDLPTCQLSWTTLAGIGYVESRHGTYAGGEIAEDGTTTVDIIGIPLDGSNDTQALPDTDGGELDGDTEWDRAIGPMQFIPSTWARWGESLEGGTPDPHNIDDAALSAARYLCADGRDLTTVEDWESAVLAYNRSGTYVTDVLAYAHAYADLS